MLKPLSPIEQDRSAKLSRLIKAFDSTNLGYLPRLIIIEDTTVPKEATNKFYYLLFPTSSQRVILRAHQLAESEDFDYLLVSSDNIAKALVTMSMAYGE